MAEIRLSKLIRQFNIGLSELVEYLNTLGLEVELNPNAKVSDEFLPNLEEHFGSRRELKEQAEKVDITLSGLLERFSTNKGKYNADDKVLETVSVNAMVAPEEFDWEAFENGGLEEEVPETQRIPTLTKNVENEIVEGIVTSINKREVVVNIGLNKEGVIPSPEFRYNPNLKVGDKVDVYVESMEDRRGMLIISHKKARQLKSWDRVNAAYETGEIVQGYVKARTKGGLLVDVFGVEAFLPGSQIDTKPIRDYDIFVDTTMDFKIVKINQEFRNVVVSHKAIIEEDKAAFISQLKKGQILEGTVKSIVDYGIFVELGVADGLIHINDLRKETSKQSNEVASVGDKVKVVILDVNRDLQRIALGLKQDTEKPRNNGPAASTTTDVFRPESIFNAKALEMLKKQNED